MTPTFPFDTTRALILDTETNDVKDPEVIELAWKTPGPYMCSPSLYFYPTRPVSMGALATHHILPEWLKNKPPSHEALGLIPQADYWIGHNIDFDWSALGQPNGVRRLCTLAMARALWPELDNHKLTTLAYFCLGATEATRALVKAAHAAADDVLLCELILSFIVRAAKVTSLEALADFSDEARIPKLWTFGKFKGRPIAAADRGYANWYKRQEDTDPYVLIALRRAGL